MSEELRNRVSRLATLLVLLGPLAGCMKKDFERLENQIQLLDKRVELLQQDQEKASSQILESWRRLRGQLEQDLTSVQKSSADSTTRIDDLIREMRLLSDRIEKTGFQYQRLSEQLAVVQDRLTRAQMVPEGVGPDGVGVTDGLGGSNLASGTEPGLEGSEPMSENPEGTGEPGAEGETAEGGPMPEPTPGTFDPGVDPDLTYKAAYSDYAQGNFKLAIVNFQTYVRQFPSSAKAVLAQYFVGESHYALGQYRDAVTAFDKVITDWPGNEKVPVAYLKKGYALLAMGQKTLGMNVLQELISKHPSTHEALLAKERLDSL